MYNRMETTVSNEKRVAQVKEYIDAGIPDIYLALTPLLEVIKIKPSFDVLLLSQMNAIPTRYSIYEDEERVLRVSTTAKFAPYLHSSIVFEYGLLLYDMLVKEYNIDTKAEENPLDVFFNYAKQSVHMQFLEYRHRKGEVDNREYAYMNIRRVVFARYVESMYLVYYGKPLNNQVHFSLPEIHFLTVELGLILKEADKGNLP